MFFSMRKQRKLAWPDVRRAYTLLVVAWLAGAGCSTPDPEYAYDANERSSTNGTLGAEISTAEQGAVSVDFSPDLLRPGNKIMIRFSGLPSPMLPHEETIREDGMVTPPLLNKPVQASGKTVGTLQEELHSLYVPAYFKSLTITVTTDERWFFVGGEVKNPGQKPYLAEMTVLKAIQAAGDFTDFANKSNVLLTRADGTGKEEVDCKKALKNSKYDRPVYPGDIIYVRRGWI